MKVVPPIWYARRASAVCEQGRSLAFRSCPHCRHVIVVCEEEGSVFPDPRALDVASSVLEPRAACPGCGQAPIGAFVATTDEQLGALGFGPEDFE